MRQIFRIMAALAFMGLPLTDANAQSRMLSDDVSMAESAFKAGHIQTGIAALQRAADQGNLQAALRLGRVYEDSKLVPRDKLKACRLYSAIAERNSEADRYSPGAPLVAEAFRRCAECYASGLAVPGWDRNMNMAAELYFQSGVMLDDPASLLELSKLYLTGEGAVQNTTMAIHLLETAARKRYPPAQAYLGWLMWDGKHMKQRQGPGLALLILANERAAPADAGWISRMYEDAMLTASKDLEREALVMVDKHKAVYQRDKTGLQIAETDVPPPVRSPSRDGNTFNFNLTKDTDRFGNTPTGAHVPPEVAPEQP